MSALSLCKQPFHFPFSQSLFLSRVRCATASDDWYAPSPIGFSGFATAAWLCVFTFALKLTGAGTALGFVAFAATTVFGRVALATGDATPLATASANMMALTCFIACPALVRG
eukprot:CAMPEP_0172846590 /NCGR_PEP_ID=MMETSP1075-20121228/37752_1 /TAXON_ID=2916 /ORGANISM="Ceratium fusus, Strain PA161109" /LENGTH=112 /DNA_ID=CAMNT_0013691439 /DNA_START=107 /DNA_END=442 /DNA_ORIENTATION=-